MSLPFGNYDLLIPALFVKFDSKYGIIGKEDVKELFLGNVQRKVDFEFPHLFVVSEFRI